MNEMKSTDMTEEVDDEIIIDFDGTATTTTVNGYQENGVSTLSIVPPGFRTNFNSFVYPEAIGLQPFSLGLFLMQNSDLCDVELIVEEKSFRAHKLILSCQSKYFEELFMDKAETYTIENINMQTFLLTLNFLYCGHFAETVYFNPESLYEFLYVSHNLRIPRLKKFCSLSVQNAGEKFDADFATRLIEHTLTKMPIPKLLFMTILNLVKPVYREMCEHPQWKVILETPKYERITQRMIQYLENGIWIKITDT